jgi:hypothetical protein
MFVTAAELATNSLDYDTSNAAAYSLVDGRWRKTLLLTPGKFLKSEPSRSFKNNIAARHHTYGNNSVDLNRHENLKYDIT